MTLSRADIDRIADAVVERLCEVDPSARTQDLTVAEVAKRYAISPDTVYANARKWGGVKVGDGPKAHWRFDADRVAAALGRRAATSPAPQHSPRRRRRQPVSSDLLPIRGKAAA